MIDKNYFMKLPPQGEYKPISVGINNELKIVPVETKVRKMRIALDIDGVCLNSMKKLVELYNDKHNTNYKLENLTKWEVWECLDCEKQEVFDLFDKITTDNLWPEVEPVDSDAPDTIRKLSQYHEIDLVTARTEESMKPVMQRLKQLGYVWNKAVVVPVYDTSAKSKLVTNYDMFIDDSPHQAEAIVSLGGMVLLYDEPWNQQVLDKPNLCRVLNFKDIEYICSAPQ